MEGESESFNGQAEDGRLNQLVVTVAAQQQEIDSLRAKLEAVLSRLEVLESQPKANGRPGGAPMKAFGPPKSAPPRRQTIDPRAMRKSSADKVDGRRSVSGMPPALNNRFKSKERLPIVKDEAGTYRMYLKGRPISLRLPEGYEQPANPTPADAPAATLQLDWVYGYRGKDCRNNLAVLASGEIIYLTAAVCVIQNTADNTQRHYLEHTDDVKSMAVHPDGVTVATGQVAGHEKSPVKGPKGASKAAANNPNYQPHIRVWNSETLQTLKMIGAGVFDRAVACISFSVTDGGNQLCAVDEHNDHRMSVWDWKKGKGQKIAEMKASQDAVFQADFHPTMANQIVCCGKNQLSFWTLEGKELKKQMALFGKHDKPKFVTCLTFNSEGDVITGDSNGSLMVWPKGTNRISSVIPAHDGVVFSVSMMEDGSLMSGGGKDRCVKVWDVASKEEKSSMQVPEQQGAVRVAIKNGDAYLVGTTKNIILSGTDLDSAEVLAEGHAGELWGLVEAPQDQFVTCAYDSQLKMWDAAARKTMWTIDTPEPVHCVALNADATLLCVGSRTPNFYMYNVESKEQTHTDAVGSEQIECVEFSPDGSHVALASRDNAIYVQKVDGQSCSSVGKCSGHTSFVTHIDWAVDGSALRSNSGDYEVLYWEMPGCKQLTDGDEIRKLEFVTQNCVLALDTVGMWQDGADGTDINGCCKNHAGNLLASADDFGQVSLYSFPSRTPDAKGHNYRGHSSHVTSVRFTRGDAHLLSCGGKDSSILQWKVMA